MRAAIAASRRVTPEPVKIEWKVCAAGCGFRLDPVIVAQGWRAHPSCEPGMPRFGKRKQLLSTRMADPPRRRR